MIWTIRFHHLCVPKCWDTPAPAYTDAGGSILLSSLRSMTMVTAPLDMFHYSEAARSGIWMCSEAESVSGLMDVLFPTSLLWLRFKSVGTVLSDFGECRSENLLLLLSAIPWSTNVLAVFNPCGLALLPGSLARIFSSILSNLGFIHLKNLVQELLWIFIYFWKMLLAKCSLIVTI